VVKRVHVVASLGLVAAALTLSACSSDPAPTTPPKTTPMESAQLLRFTKEQVDGWARFCKIPDPDPGTPGAIVVSADGKSVDFTAYYSDDMVDARSQGKVMHFDGAACILELAFVDDATIDSIIGAEGGHRGYAPIEGGQIAWDKPHVAALNVTIEARD